MQSYLGRLALQCVPITAMLLSGGLTPPIFYTLAPSFLGHQTATSTMCKLTIHFTCNHGYRRPTAGNKTLNVKPVRLQ